MLDIIAKLVAFGMDFEYENLGSAGEKITCYQLGLKVSNQNGKIYFENSAPTEIFTESNEMYLHIASLVEQECINETASF